MEDGSLITNFDRRTSPPPPPHRRDPVRGFPRSPPGSVVSLIASTPSFHSLGVLAYTRYRVAPWKGSYHGR